MLLGAPPKRIASHGRANPAGIPYLYLGSSPVVAISEIRPHTGERACVADFTTPVDLKLTDLRGYQGVIYRSSVSDGINLALFDPARARCGTVIQHRVIRVSVDIAPGD